MNNDNDKKTFRQLLQISMKSPDTEETIDVYFTRPIGLVFALFWNKLGVHPNAITTLSIFLGVGAGVMFGFSDLWHNVAGVVLLMFANFCDSTDGQMARITGKKTRIGRMLDGFAGDMWFLSIYAALSVRLFHQHIPFTNIEWSFWIFLIAFVAGVLCHSPQASLADYYRQIHLLFVLGRDGSELDSYESQHAIYEQLPEKGALLDHLFYYNYQNYCRSQERRTPRFQAMYALLKKRYGSIEQVPQAMRNDFRKKSLPLMPLTNILTFNWRAISLYTFCLLDIPLAFFLMDIVVFNAIYHYMRNRHETISGKFMEQMQTEG